MKIYKQHKNTEFIDIFTYIVSKICFWFRMVEQR